MISFILLACSTRNGVAVEVVLEAEPNSASPATRDSSWTSTWQATTAANDGLGMQIGVISYENGRHDSDGLWRVIRPLFVFDTTSLPASATITNLRLEFRVQSVAIAQDDPESYVRAVVSFPVNPTNLTPSDFGRIYPTPMAPVFYSQSHYLRGMAAESDYFIDLNLAMAPHFATTPLVTIALMGGHEIEDADHFSAPNVHNQGFHTYSPSSSYPPTLHVEYADTVTTTTTPMSTTTTLPLTTACSAIPRMGCLKAAKTQLHLRRSVDATHNQLSWMWQRGDRLRQSDLGDPTTATSYFLCLYDRTASVAALVGELAIDPNAAWMSKGDKGFVYKDSLGVEDGVEKAKLKAGEAGKTQAQIKARGVNLPLPVAIGSGWYFDQDPSILVQLINSEGLCLTSEFSLSDTLENSEAQFKAKVSP